MRYLSPKIAPKNGHRQTLNCDEIGQGPVDKTCAFEVTPSSWDRKGAPGNLHKVAAALAVGVSRHDAHFK